MTTPAWIEFLRTKQPTVWNDRANFTSTVPTSRGLDSTRPERNIGNSLDQPNPVPIGPGFQKLIASRPSISTLPSAKRAVLVVTSIPNAQQSAQFKERMHQRNAIEGTVSELARAHGLRRGRYRGFAKVELQNLLIATACNIKRWLQAIVQSFSGCSAARTCSAAAIFATLCLLSKNWSRFSTNYVLCLPERCDAFH